MKNTVKILFTATVIILALIVLALPTFALTETTAVLAADEEITEAVVNTPDPEATVKSNKAIASAVVVGIVATAGALGMAWAICKSVDGIARQPEAEGKIRTTLMLGLVFVETAIIYALVIGILIIFVL